jgi:hypothetical protein
MMIRFGWDSEHWRQWIEALYLTWLYGKSTRQIAKVLGCDKNVLVNLLERYYGEDAVNPAAKSLLRSLAEDYPDDSTTLEFIKQNIRIKEKCEGYSYVTYTSHYAKGTTVRKTLNRPLYVQHRSNHSMDELTRAQCMGDLVINRQRSSENEFDA